MFGDEDDRTLRGGIGRLDPVRRRIRSGDVRIALADMIEATDDPAPQSS
ncbi:hypothetical protein ACFFNY_03370 [Paenibacillus hodogayensis]|uniref:Uncharacterized protein n=1 Tax=Paenibacillus hodogayensis TaxID=279208 RepID=A0ABV5VQP7_9BACL